MFASHAHAQSQGSELQHAYERRMKRRSQSIMILQWGILIAFLSLWEVAAWQGWIDPFLLSSPSRIVKTIANLVREGDLWSNLGISLWETLLGFLVGGALGAGLAIAFWWSEYLSRVMDPYIVVLNALPKIAMGPILIVWLGAGQKAIIAMAVLISVVVTLITMLTGFREVGEEKQTLMRSFGATRGQILRMLILPGSLPTTISALKLNIGMSWVGVIVGEFLVSRAGLGYLIVYGGQVFKLDLVMAATALLCVAVALMYIGIAAIEKIVRKKRGL